MINDMKFLTLRNIAYKYIKANRYPLVKKSALDNKIKELKDIHYGKACFIIGNGPSLVPKDLESISNSGIVSFASNAIYKIFGQTSWRPTYYVLQDQQVIDGLVTKFSEFADVSKGLFVRRDVYKQLSEDVLKKDNLYLPRLIMHIRKDKYYDFFEDLSYGASDGCTVTYFMMQIAYYMGFKKIYLVGIDHNFPTQFDENDNIIITNAKKQHCFEDSKEIIMNPARVLETTYAYKSAKLFFDSKDIKIYNATRGGRLEVYKRINLEEAIIEGK
ncbi:6-hydroxymethylpterin diphosphokinase MptE-like protein [Lachnospiraceae bacterium 62-35]